MCSHCSPFLTASLYSSQTVLQPCRLHTLGAFCKHKWVCQPPPLLYCWMHSSTFLSLQVKAKPCQAAGVQLPAWSFLIHQSAPIKTTRIISWHRYAITGNLITNFDGAESLEQWSSTKSVDNCVRKTILITMKCYKNQLLTSYYICSSGGEIHVPSVVSSVAFQWQIRKEVFTASSKHLVATIWALYSPP